MRWHALRGCWQLNSASPSWTLKSAKLGLLFNNCLFALFSLYCVKWCGLSSLVTNKTNILLLLNDFVGWLRPSAGALPLLVYLFGMLCLAASVLSSLLCLCLFSAAV